MLNYFKSNMARLILCAIVLIAIIPILILYKGVATDQQVDPNPAVWILGILALLCMAGYAVLPYFRIHLLGFLPLVGSALLFAAFAIYMMNSFEYLGLIAVYHYSVARFIPATICFGVGLAGSSLLCFLR